MPQTEEQIDACFGAGPFDLVAGLRKGKGDEAIGHYFYGAFGPDGVTPVGYALEVTGTFSTTGASFAPGPGETTTVTWTGGLQHVNGEGVGCVGGGGKHSAQKHVDISGTVTILGIS